MSDFLDDIEDIQYSVRETGDIGLYDLAEFLDSLEYDSLVSVSLSIKDVEIIVEYDPKEETFPYLLSINEEEIKLPETIKSLKEVGVFMINYLKLNF